MLGWSIGSLHHLLSIASDVSFLMSPLIGLFLCYLVVILRVVVDIVVFAIAVIIFLGLIFLLSPSLVCFQFG